MLVTMLSWIHLCWLVLYWMFLCWSYCCKKTQTDAWFVFSGSSLVRYFNTYGHPLKLIWKSVLITGSAQMCIMRTMIFKIWSQCWYLKCLRSQCWYLKCHGHSVDLSDSYSHYPDSFISLSVGQITEFKLCSRYILNDFFKMWLKHCTTLTFLQFSKQKHFSDSLMLLSQSWCNCHNPWCNCHNPLMLLSQSYKR